MPSSKIVFFFLMSFFLFQSEVSAASGSDLEVDVNLVSDFKISKSDILKSLDTLKKEGKISNADYEKAKKELMAMNDSQVGSIQDKAMDIVKKDPKKAQEMVKEIQKPN